MARQSLREDRPVFCRPTNVSLDAKLVDEAKELGLNISRACETGLATQIAEVKMRRWLIDNVSALASSNAYVDAYGLPLAAPRPF